MDTTLKNTVQYNSLIKNVFMHKWFHLHVFPYIPYSRDYESTNISIYLFIIIISTAVLRSMSQMHFTMLEPLCNAIWYKWYGLIHNYVKTFIT